MATSASAFEENCVQFFHLQRPLGSRLLTHEFIASLEGNQIRLYGLTKGKADFNFAESQLPNPSNPGALIQARLICGKKKTPAIETAKRASIRWNHRFRNWLPYLARMAFTPLLGKPCGRAAAEIMDSIGAVSHMPTH